MNKKAIRKKYLLKRDLIPEDVRINKSSIISKRLSELEEYINSDIILSYASYRSEVITDNINQNILDDNKILYLPKTYSDTGEIYFFKVDNLSKLETGYMGIREPKDNIENKLLLSDELPDKILIIMPGVAYDIQGNRLGYGGGYYDRFLDKYPPLQSRTVMLSYSEQKSELIPTDDNDIKPAMILSDDST